MGEGLKLRKDIDAKYKWNVEKMYLDTACWGKEFDFVKKEAVKLKEYEGKLDKKENILNYLLEYEKLARKVNKLYVYASMRSHEDTSNTEFQGLLSRIESFYAEFMSYVSFFEPEILAKDEEKFMNMVRNSEKLKIYEF